MPDIKEKDFIAEIIFCIQKSDVVKAKALVQFFAEISPKAQNRVLYELSKSPDGIAFPVLDYLLGVKSEASQINKKVYDLLLEIAYGNAEMLVSQIGKPANPNKPVYIRIAGDLKLRESVPTLIDLLSKEEDEQVLGEAIQALGSIGTEACVEALIAFLDSKDVVLKSAGISALSEIGTPSAIESLYNAVSGDNRTDQSIIQGLAGIQNQLSMDKLSGMLGSSLAGIRSLAIEGLIQIGPKAVPSLMEKLKSKDPNVQIHALTILGKIEDPTAIPAIQQLLYEKPQNANVRFGAYEALGRLPSAKTAISLARGLEDPDEQVRMAAAKAIDKNLSNVLVAGMKNMIKSGDENAKQVVATFIDAEADNVFDTLVEWEAFEAIAVDYLSTKAHPDTRDHYVMMLKGKKDVQEKIRQAGGEASEDQRPLIIAVDDSVMMLKLYKKKLYAMGFRAMVFQHPSEALKALRKDKPVLLITDLNMPMINGLQLTKEVRALHDDKSLPIIMITTQSDFLGRGKEPSAAPINEETIMKAGVNMVMHKPFHDQDLAAAIQQFTGQGD